MKGSLSRKNISEKHARRLLEFLSEIKKRSSPLLILTHDYPDPDALASAYALHHIAQSAYGIACRIVYGGVIGRAENQNMVMTLRIPIHKLKAGDFKKYTLFSLVDTQPMFENNSFPSDKRATLVIDQHPTVGCVNSEFSILDTECGATCVILSRALFLLKTTIPKKIATALAYGILTDTLNLYRVQRYDAIQTYLDILPHSDMRALALLQRPSRRKKFFKTLARGISQTVLYDGIVVSHLKEVDGPELVAETADFLLTYRTSSNAMCSGRYKGRLHASFRTKKNIQAAKILRETFPNPKDAGGHDMIAGGSVKIGKDASEEQWQEAESNLTKRLLSKLHISNKEESYHPFI